MTPYAEDSIQLTGAVTNNVVFILEDCCCFLEPGVAAWMLRSCFIIRAEPCVHICHLSGGFRRPGDGDDVCLCEREKNISSITAPVQRNQRAMEYEDVIYVCLSEALHVHYVG